MSGKFANVDHVFVRPADMIQFCHHLFPLFTALLINARSVHAEQRQCEIEARLQKLLPDNHPKFEMKRGASTMEFNGVQVSTVVFSARV